MANSNQTSNRLGKQLTQGELDASPEAIEIYLPTANLNPTKVTVENQDLRGDRMQGASQEVHGRGSAVEFGGDLNFEVLDYLIGAVTLGDIVEVDGTALNGTLTLDSATDTLVFTDALDYDDISQAKLIRIAGSADPLNDGAYDVIGIDDGTKTITLKAGSVTSDDDSTTTPGLLGSCKYSRNGVITIAKPAPIFFAEQAYIGTDQYVLAQDLHLNTFGVDLATRQLATWSGSFMGMKKLATASDTVIDTLTPASAEKLNTARDIGTVQIDGNAPAGRIQTLSFEVANNFYEIDGVGAGYEPDHGVGHLGITGNFGAIFTSDALLNQFLDHGSSEISIPISSPAGSRANIYLPNIEWPGDYSKNIAYDQQVVEDLSFVANAGHGGSYIIQIDLV